MDENQWRILKHTTVFPNKWRKVDEYKVQTPCGSIEDFYITVVPNTVMVFALTKDNEVIVNKQFNVFQNKRMYELPAGYIDEKKSPLVIAKKELREETGHIAKRWVKLGEFFVERWSTNRMSMFLALDARQVGKQQLEDSEDIEVECMSLKKFKKMISENKVENGPSLVCAYKAFEYLEM